MLLWEGEGYDFVTTMADFIVLIRVMVICDYILTKPNKNITFKKHLILLYLQGKASNILN